MIALGINGRSTVNDSLKQEQIVGTPDMTPALIKAEAAKAGLTNVQLETRSVAGKEITNGRDARAPSRGTRNHTLEATHGQTYAQMPRYVTADGKGTNDPAEAPQSKGQPVANACGCQKFGSVLISDPFGRAVGRDAMFDEDTRLRRPAPTGCLGRF